MRKLQIRTVIFMLAGALSSGCASQNAMTMIPGNLKAEIAAERAERSPGKGAVSVEAMLASARKDKPGGEKAKAGNEDMAEPVKTAETAAAAESRPSAIRAEPEEVPGTRKKKILSKAASRIATALEDTAGYEGVTAPDVWARFQEMQEAEAGEPLAETDMMATAALPDRPRGDPVDVRFAGEALERDSDLKIRLMISAGRKAGRIVIGKVAGAPFEALAAARARAAVISSLTGGQPVISYDPAMKAGEAMVLFAPNPRRDG